MQITVYQYDAFCTIPGKGNPAGVVFNADGLTGTQMQAIAQKTGFNETAFVLSSEAADVRLRYFSPGHEVDLCGHATVGALFGLNQRFGFASGDHTLETNAGVLEVSASRAETGVLIGLTQKPAQFVPFEGDTAAVAEALGLSAADIVPEMPLVYGSTGLWTLIVPVSGLGAMKRMKPKNARFPGVLAQMPRASVHPFCLETLDPAADMHGRHFSSPYSGTVEDAVTGTASGVMGVYHARYIAKRDGSFSYLVEQGQEIGRDGRVRVEVESSGSENRVRIFGTAVFAGELKITV